MRQCTDLREGSKGQRRGERASFEVTWSGQKPRKKRQKNKKK